MVFKVVLLCQTQNPGPSSASSLNPLDLLSNDVLDGHLGVATKLLVHWRSALLVALVGLDPRRMLDDGSTGRPRKTVTTSTVVEFGRLVSIFFI